MAKFRKRPVEVEAMQWLPDGLDEVAAVLNWLNQGGAKYQPEGVHGDEKVRGTTRVKIETLEGVMTASPGDWIIRGVKGEFYPCKPDIFEATYEPVPPPIRRWPLHVQIKKPQLGPATTAGFVDHGGPIPIWTAAAEIPANNIVSNAWTSDR